MMKRLLPHRNASFLRPSARSVHFAKPVSAISNSSASSFDAEWHGVGAVMPSYVRARTRLPSGQSLSVKFYDITKEECDAIVNAANILLKHSGGLAHAIVCEGGFSIQEESDEYVSKHGVVPVGSVAVTGAGTLRAKVIIHAVGPTWTGAQHSEEADQKLRSTVWNVLDKARTMGLSSIALPGISGAFGFPISRCASVMINTAKDFCEQYPHEPPSDIRLTNNDEPTVTIFENEFRSVFFGEE